MRETDSLASSLRSLVDLVIEESAQNPTFAAKVEKLFAKLADPKPRATEARSTRAKIALPDVHAEWTNRGETEFRFWLKDQPITVIRALIRQLDLDPTRRTSRWKEQEKLAAFVADGLKARSQRGSAFLGPNASS